MTYVALSILGLCLGSFVNALVWRIYQQEQAGHREKVRGRSKKNNKLSAHSSDLSRSLSILQGRSMCPSCKHELAAKDLVPILSWLQLKGRCRYCQKPISVQYPLVEVATAVMFLLSYILWPYGWTLDGLIDFGVWLIVLTGFMALTIYDFRWMILPNRIVYPLIMLVGVRFIYHLVVDGDVLNLLLNTALSVLIAGAVFYALFTISKGKWIGGGDVKLGFLLGLLLMNPSLAFMTIMFASLLGTVVVLPGMVMKKITTKSHVPFGPFLIVGGIIAYLLGHTIIEWYKRYLLGL